MAKRTTRSKIQWQVDAALDDMHMLQNHLGQAAALANGRHPALEKALPSIMTSIDLTEKALRALRVDV